MRVLEGIKPERVMYYFEEITRIPRCSHKEKQISDYLVKVGRDLGLEVIQDKALNVIIKKPGFSGYENSPIVVLQGHMDMVCEKTESSSHDFLKDPIKIKVEGDYLIAKETTLGADNGIALAMILSVLESKDIPHPPIEALFTSDEESGMSGALALNPNHIDGKMLINLDSEEEGTALVSCAGGERNIVSIPIKWQDLPTNKEHFELSISGLQGGHSGMEINKGRGNSNKIMGRVLDYLVGKIDMDLWHIEGGSKSNAIPRFSKANIVVAKEDVDKLNLAVSNIEKELKTELSHTDKDVEINISPIVENDKRVFTKDTLSKVISALVLIPNGVQTMSGAIEGLVESSTNLGVVNTVDGNVTLESSIRSSLGTLKAHISNQIKLLCQCMNIESESLSAYPAWQYKENSYIREVLKETYREIYNKDLNISAIHAGLECGLFDEKFEDMDMISFGPNMYGVHAPGEKLSISSTSRTYDFLLKVLEKIR
ncbi:MAG: aminoacyl-histidine dipeptidase [Tissierellaceae bacterium]|nr:aminoacyl-histidine dipeptidase [Tissierellaceae bacterium]